MISPRRGGTDTLVRASRVVQGLSAIVVLAVATLPAQGQTTSDVLPPTLQAFSFTPSTVDVSAGSQTIAFALRLTDDLSGAAFATVFLRSPTGIQTALVSVSRISGDGLDGMWAGNIVLPQFSAGGVWTVSSVSVQDAAGNFSSISTAVLESRFMPTQLTIISTPDIQPPTVTGLTISPSAMNVSANDQTLTVDIRATDNLSGVAFLPCVPNPSFGLFSVILRSPSGAQNRFVWSSTFTLVSGDRASGTWRSTMTMPRFSEAGTWRVLSVSVHDCAGNQRFMNESQVLVAGLQSSLTVDANPTDIQAPQLTSLSFLPTNINTSTGNQVVTVRIGVSDVTSGADFSPTLPQVSFFERGIQFRSPSGNQVQSAAFFAPFTLVSGDVFNGVWQTTVGFPKFSEDGTWKVDLLTVKDRARNITTFNTAGLQALGFPTTLEVIKPSLIVDGTVGSGGGGVNDQVFGDRASVFFPVGALSAPSQVAIDVLSKPLDVPNPTGFTGPGTLYVNIHVTPTPNFPLASPGLTVTLPIEHPMIAGSQLSLYKVDSITGSLIPAINVFGGPVIGHVNADGLSATFFGIASLSTVVGLVPEALNVGVDIKPGDSPNTINLKSRGVLPVAILSSATFDARTVLPESVLLAGASVRLKGNGQPAVAFEDVNGDGRLDLLLQFDSQSLDITSNDTEAHLTGRTNDGLRIVGHDSIRIVP